MVVTVAQMDFSGGRRKNRKGENGGGGREGR